MKFRDPQCDNWGDKIIEAHSVISRLEDILQEGWFGPDWWRDHNTPTLREIKSDSYDGSLEFDVYNVSTFDQAKEFMEKCVDVQFRDFVRRGGVHHFWINFYANEDSEERLFEGSVFDRVRRIWNCKAAEFTYLDPLTPYEEPDNTKQVPQEEKEKPRGGGCFIVALAAILLCWAVHVWLFP